MRKTVVVLFGVFLLLAVASSNALAVTYYTLTVKSTNPSSGAAIAMSPSDRYGRGEGTAQFSRSFARNTSVTLTAPAAFSGKSFQKWKKGTADYSINQSVSIAMTAGTTMTAVYIDDTTSPTTSASPPGGTFTGSVTVALSADEAATTYYCTGAGCSPTTAYAAPLDFTAATTLRYYSVDGAGNTETVKESVYTPATYTLNVTSTNDVFSGMSVSISPADRNGLGDGRTLLTRTYDAGSVVTLKLPPISYSGETGCSFHRWQKNGGDLVSGSTLTITMDGNTNIAILNSCTLYISREISVSPPDINGNSRIPGVLYGGSLSFIQGTVITTTYHSPWSCKDVDYWRKSYVNNVGTTSENIAVHEAAFAMDKTYVLDVITKNISSPKLSIGSSNPDSGLDVTFALSGASRKMDIATPLSLWYQCGSPVGVSVPQTLPDGRVFLKWTKDGEDYATTPATGFGMTEDIDVTAVYGPPPVTNTLTIATSNPDTGVAIAITPKDAAGQGNAAAQFSRSYAPGIVVTLSAPTRAGGNMFRKWQKDGTDYALSQAVSVTMDAAVSMTAVYDAPTNAHAGLTWNSDNLVSSYGICQQCHLDKANEVMSSLHYQWNGNAEKMIGGNGGYWNSAVPELGKIGKAMNAFCINILGNFDNAGGCANCHVGRGLRPDDTSLTTQQHLDNIDCLLCHQKAYKRKKDAATGRFVPDTANMTITMNQALQTVHKPERANCLQCHAKAGGGDAVKRGDLALASGTTADRHYDVHMATTGANLQCQGCHVASAHKIPGRGSDLRPIEAGNVSCSTTACHPAKTTSTGHLSSAVHRHLDRVACQTCHITVYSKNASDTAADEATEMSRDWRVREWSTANNRWEAIRTTANDQKPVYKWFNGTSWGYDLGVRIGWSYLFNPLDPTYLISFPLSGGEEYKLTPFKYKTAYQPITTDRAWVDTILIPLSTKKYFETGDYDASVKDGLANFGYPATTSYQTVRTAEYLMLNHQVTPMADNPLQCASCHTTNGVPGAMMNLNEMYLDADNVCKKCHSLTAPPVSSTGWPWQFVHGYTEYMLPVSVTGDARCNYCHSSYRGTNSLDPAQSFVDPQP